MNKDQLYHQIAVTCLKTLREGSNAEAGDQVKALYDAIDTAFQSQFALLVTELEDAKERLNHIAALDPERHTLRDAQIIIDQSGTAH
ncbi:MAG: hypothetical protein ABNH15_02360 [Alcanivorax sp.]|nr:MAG: hypothetical protein COA68_01090 [Oceanobacter sp.]